MVSLGVNNNINMKNQYSPNMNTSVPLSFKSGTLNQQKMLKEDTVEISSKKGEKKGLSKGVKRALIAGGVLATAFLALRYGPKIIATCNVKRRLPIRSLPENITFTEAKTLEEARKYASETLQIKKIDENITLETLNFINKGLTDVSNAQKGKVVMPTAVRMRKLEGASAAVKSSLWSKNVGEMTINENFFSLNDFNEVVKRELKMPDGKNVYYKDASGKYRSRYVYNKIFKPKFDDESSKLLDKFYANPDSLSKSEKLSLKLILKSGISNGSVNIDKQSPIVLLARFKDEFKKRGINYDLADFNGKSDSEIRKFINEKIEPVIASTNNHININLDMNCQYKTIYHEMGHLQDINKNYGVITEKMNIFKTLRTKIFSHTNHFAKKTDKEIIELMKTEKGRNLLKKEAPLTYEFITDKNIQNVAAEVSDYATTGIGEFVAETYAQMVSGKPLSQKVKDLYAKYNGPILPI